MQTKTAKLRQLPDGTIQARSSNGRDVYTVTLGAQPSCTCPAGRNGRACYHLAGAAERFAALWPIPAALRLPANVTRFSVRTAAPARRAEISDLYA